MNASLYMNAIEVYLTPYIVEQFSIIRGHRSVFERNLRNNFSMLFAFSTVHVHCTVHVHRHPNVCECLNTIYI